MKKKVLIFGSTSSIAQNFEKNYNKKFELIKISSKNSIRADFKKFEYSEKNFIDLEKKINSKKIFSIINFCGYFSNKSNESLSRFINYEIAKKIIDFSILHLIKMKVRVITITSLDSVHANTNDVHYSLYKSLTSKYIKNMKLLYKNEKIQFDDLQLGAVNTKMRKKNLKDGLNANEISKLINFILSLNYSTTLNPVKIFPKKKTYLEY